MACSRAPRRWVDVDKSIVDRLATRALNKRPKERGIVSLDASVSGGERGAMEATLSVMVGSPTDAHERIRPILEKMHRTIIGGSPRVES